MLSTIKIHYVYVLMNFLKCCISLAINKPEHEHNNKKILAFMMAKRERER